jgi:hypothetical protein
MRKQTISATIAGESVEGRPWLDLTEKAEVELTSEDAEHRIENALSSGAIGGWKAAGPGKQMIRLLFKRAQDIRRIRLEFIENEIERSQEFALYYAEENDATLREVRRQQWTFSPQGSVRETEDYTVDLNRVAVLQLTIDPDRGKDRTAATLNKWSVA